ncbi:hypothetical protein TIFTF001_038898 [Ficus carica]|uniref:Uncharacterized protein n=1 Tax=Ficus carica TaxID=3494 RepID=A0AA88EJ75_FICCA|nr:hypothetical protein TIFTF001_038898 [Ficus carica]
MLNTPYEVAGHIGFLGDQVTCSPRQVLVYLTKLTSPCLPHLAYSCLFVRNDGSSQYNLHTVDYTAVHHNSGFLQKVPTAYHVSSRQKMNVQMDELDALKTTSNDLGSGSQDDVFIDSDIGAVTDMGVQAVIYRVPLSQADVEEEKERPSVECYKGEKNKSMPDLEKEKEEEKDDKEDMREHEEIKLEEAANEESIGDVIPKQKRSRLSRLGQRRSRPMTEVGSPSHALSKLIYALPPGLADEPPKEKLEEFREWINKGLLKRTPPSKWPPKYNAKYETMAKPHDLEFMAHINVAFYYLRKKIMQFPELVQRKVTTVDTFFSAKVGALWRVYQKSPDTFDWGLCDSLFKIILDALVKLDLTNWTIEVYDSLQHEGPHNFKVRKALEWMHANLSGVANMLLVVPCQAQD